VGVVSAYPPRRDGFAEDAQDLVHALADEIGAEVAVCAVGRRGLHYPDEVVVAADIDDRADYRRGAQLLVDHGVDAAVIRYADGMYGGPHGAHILDLAQELGRHGTARVISLLTVPTDVQPAWTRTVAALTAGAAAVLVPSETARASALARRVATADQLTVVSFGVPRAVVAGSAGQDHESALLANALRDAGPVVVTVRICGQGGLDPILAAVRELAPQRPATRLVVVRLGRLPEDNDQRLVEAHGLADQVRIVDAHVPAASFAGLLARASAYLAIGDDPDLPRAMAAGCPTLVIPDGTTTASAPALASALAAVLDDPAGRQHARYAAAQAGTGYGWPAIGRRHAEVLRVATPAAPAPVVVPSLRLDWLDRDLGRLRSFEPDRDARLASVAAGLLSIDADGLSPSARRIASGWAGRTVRALGVAVQVGPSVAGGARAAWGLGALAAGPGVPAPLRRRAAVLRALLVPSEPADLAGAADIVLGLCDDPDLGALEWRALGRAAARIDDARRRRRDWPVFTDRVGPGDIRAAHALVAGGRRLDDQSMVDRGVESVEWLAFRAGLGSAPGAAWRPPFAGPHRGVDAGGWVEALATAYAVSGLAAHARMAQQAMHWFLGANAAGDSVLDAELGVCRDGLGPAAPVAQPSASSTLAYLRAVLSLHEAGLADLPVAEVSRQDLATVA
jgi:hypothetical protein